MINLITAIKNTRSTLLYDSIKKNSKISPVIFLGFKNENSEYDIEINLLGDNKFLDSKSIISDLALRQWKYDTSGFSQSIENSQLAYFCWQNHYNKFDYHYCFDYENNKVLEYIINDKQQEIETKISILSNMAFFDTETTGLPNDFNNSIYDLQNWPRLVQLAWQLFNINGTLIKKKDYIIRPEGFSIPVGAFKIHQISNEIAMEEGTNLKTVLTEFSQDIQNTFYIIGHNINFDYNILSAEYIRCNMKNPLIEKHQICTMKSSTNFCKIQNNHGFKWPSLSELHNKLFNQNFNESHNAVYDIEATQKCFWKLKELNVIDKI